MVTAAEAEGRPSPAAERRVALPRGQRRRLGILTGSGPRAGLDLMDKLLQANEEMLGGDFAGDKDAPYVVSLSSPGVGGPHGVWDTLPDSEGHEALWLAVREAVLALAPLVDYLCLACNTLHRFQPQVEALLVAEGYHCKFVSIVDNAVQWCQRHGASRVSVMGSRLTTDVHGVSPYAAMVQGSFSLVVPEDEYRDKQQQALELVKRHGPAAAAARDLLQSVVDSIEADTLVLACTEFPLVRLNTSKNLVDPTALLARKMAALGLGLDTVES